VHDVAKRKGRPEMSGRQPIRGKVARILNTREVVINRGIKDGVTRGMTFAILDPNVADVTDPDTGEVLGTVERPKVHVRAVEVADRLTVAKTYRFHYEGGSVFTGVSGLFEPRRKIYDSLEIDGDTWADLGEDESYVKVGDPVKETEFDDA
jgi:hypothetical protein